MVLHWCQNCVSVQYLENGLVELIQFCIMHWYWQDVKLDGIIPRHLCRGYIVFAFPFIHLSACMFVHSFVHPSRSWNLPQIFPQSCVKVSQVGGISHELLIRKHSYLPWKVCFLAMSFGPRVHAPGWGWRSKSRMLLKCFSTFFVMETTYTDSWSDMAQPYDIDL